MNKKYLPVVLSGFALLGLGGCNSISRSGTSPADSIRSGVAARSNPLDVISEGMTAGEVRVLVGEPREIKTQKVEDTEAEIWRYSIKVDQVVRQVPVGLRDVPAVDVITGQPIIVKESVLGEEFTTLYHDIELLMIGDRVVKIFRSPRVERHTVN